MFMARRMTQDASSFFPIKIINPINPQGDFTFEMEPILTENLEKFEAYEL